MVTDKLFRRLNTIVKSYPEGIVRVPDKRIKGTAFFSGGDGFLHEQKDFKKSEIMILAHDFGTVENFEESILSRREFTMPKDSPTWNNLEKILENAGQISMDNCFFTNAIMGLRKGVKKNTGRHKAFLEKEEQFLEECREFFIEQLKAQKPKLIIGLGAHIPKFLSGTSKNLECLSKITSLSKIGKSVEENLFNDVVFDGFTGYKTNIIFITHPSFYDRNVIYRLGREKGKEKSKAFEYKLIGDAVNCHSKPANGKANPANG
jgi:hypothetical protein